MINYELKPGRIDLFPGKEYEGRTLSEFLEYFHTSRKNRYLMVLNKQVLLNRKPAASENETLKAGDTVTVLLPSEPVDYVPAEEECRVVYEDDFVYIAHKDAGLIVHGPQGDTDCLAAQAAAYQINHGIEAPVRFIHRLDEETSGLVLFVKIPYFQPWYDAALEARDIHRHYLAITAGRAHPGQKFTYNQKIGKDRHVNGKYRFSETGKEAVTIAEVVDKKKDYELIRCQLETGRTHQIRVHLSGNRHPIVNDPLYGVASHDFKGMGLWAYELVFPNPLTDEIITVHDVMNPDYAMFPMVRKLLK